ncbi:hypothetical protein BX070DRAFT_220766 [Coemansia spiralis]|nr:hypothetical protein BX070DRAFT_220766 [Coemansia spiralis]
MSSEVDRSLASAIFGKQPLFVKETDDFIYQKGSSVPGKRNDGFRTSVYKHFESEMRIVLCRVPCPIYTLNIYVPTAVTNDKGLPHTLEHLVFCGSKNYPDRGYLDALANCNYSTGTNAWTDSDNTCYTLSAGSEGALANVLPAFLDHVLSPLLRDVHFVTEVYHYDTTGKEQGVVFSEMVSFENDEPELSFLQLSQLMFNTQATYAHYFGGKTTGIALLTNEEVIEYHRKFYDANNITIVLTGAFSDNFEEKCLQTLPKEIIQSLAKERYATRAFASSDTDTGSFNFGWHGPPHEDTELILAFEILFEYLAGSSSSPLHQRFVERPSPLAGALSACVFERTTTVLSLEFVGVPYADGEQYPEHAEGSGDDEEYDDDEVNDYDEEADDPDIAHLFEECYFEELLLEELKRIHQSRFDGDKHALKNAATRVCEGLAAKMEREASDLLQEQLYPDIVASHFSPDSQGKFHIGSRAKQFDMLEDLGNRPIEYWLDLLKKWLLDRTVYHVAMIPDVELGSKLETERKEIEKANKARIADKDAHAKYIKQAIEAGKAYLPDSLKQSMPMPNPAGVGTLPHTEHMIIPASDIGPISAVQIIQVDSGFSEAQLYIPIGNLSDDMRMYLALFQELMLNTDIVLPAGVIYDTEEEPLLEDKRIGFMDVESRLSDIVTTRSAFVGRGSDQLSCGWLDEWFIVNFGVVYHKYALAARWITQYLVFADFTIERILTAAQNLVTSISEIKRDGESVANAVEQHFIVVSSEGKPCWNESHISFLGQEGVLKRIIEKVKGDSATEVIEKLRGIQHILLQAKNGFISLSVPYGEDYQSYIDGFTHEWNACMEKYSYHRNEAVTSNPGYAATESTGFLLTAESKSSPFPIKYTSRFPVLAKPLLVHVPVQTLQTAFATTYLEIDLVSFPSMDCSFDEQLADLPALDYYALVMLVEILARMDGPLYNAVRGKGYAYGAQMCLVRWTSQLYSIVAIKEAIADVGNNWNSYIGDFEMHMARSVQSTPKMVLAECIKSSIYGFSTLKEHTIWRNQSDMRRVYDKYVRRFLDNEYPAVTVLGSFIQTTLEELSASYMVDY